MKGGVVENQKKKDLCLGKSADSTKEVRTELELEARKARREGGLGKISTRVGQTNMGGAGKPERVEEEDPHGSRSEPPINVGGKSETERTSNLLQMALAGESVPGTLQALGIPGLRVSVAGRSVRKPQVVMPSPEDRCQCRPCKDSGACCVSKLARLFSPISGFHL